MRTVYLGTSDFAVTVLERLAASDHRPALVVTRPDRPRGRGRRLASPPVAESARALGLELLQPDSVNSDEARAAVAGTSPDAVCICAYGALIREPLLSEHPMLNVHPSLLPRWRGAAPIERSIEAGDPETGVSIMRPIMEMDAGPVCLQRREPIHPDDDYGSLSARLAPLGGDLLVEALDTSPPFVEQPADGVTVAPKIEAADRALDPSLDAAANERRVRALTPHVGAYVVLPGDERLRVRRAAVSDAPPPPPSELAADGDRLFYGCVDGALELLEVQPAGGRPMDAGAYLRGHGARVGRG
ncbi:MAG: methionyl-tRNA formyltransferase [Actinobacteria bacterium]|nr:methionyl-tRNA formyltransferase [Actinomycetota bacterium]